MLRQVNGVTGKYLTGAGVVTTAGKPGLLFGYTLLGGTDISSIIFKNGGASGTALWKDSVKAQTAAGDATVSYTFTEPIVFSTDIYATLAGTDAALSVAYYQLS